MGTVLTYFGSFLAAVFIVVVIGCLILLYKYLSWFKLKPCKHCGHKMEYKGLKEDGKNGYYLFHCKKCNSWEEIPKDIFIRDLDKEDLEEV